MDQVALITGGARGIGLATGRAFLDAGWSIALLDIDGPAQAAAAAAFEASDRVLALTCDVADEEQVDRSVKTVLDRYGRLDALVNNAGTAVFRPVLETTPEEWRRVLDVNLTGPFLVTRAAANRMGGGSAV